MVKVTFKDQVDPTPVYEFKMGHIYKSVTITDNNGLFIYGKTNIGLSYLVNIETGYMIPASKYQIRLLDITDRVSISIPIERKQDKDEDIDQYLYTGNTYIENCSDELYIVPYLVASVDDTYIDDTDSSNALFLYSVDLVNGTISRLPTDSIYFKVDHSLHYKKCNIDISIAKD